MAEQGMTDKSYLDALFEARRRSNLSRTISSTEEKGLEQSEISPEDLIPFSKLIGMAKATGVGLGGILGLMLAKGGTTKTLSKEAGVIASGADKEVLESLYKESAINKALYNKADFYSTMPPNDFLQLAHSLGNPMHPDSIANIKNLKEVGKFNDVPYLEVGINNKGKAVVTAHEGRHRIKALQELGIADVPVVIAPDYSLRKTTRDNLTSEEFRDWLLRLEDIYPESGSSNIVKMLKKGK